jgi:hypothetical protein
MKAYLLILTFFTTVFSSCQQEEPKSYFPFKEYLENELKQIDSLPVAIFKYSLSKEKTDTSIIEKQAFRKIATAVLDIDLQHEDVNKIYKELVLEDTDIDNIAISYTTEEKQTPIKQLQLNIRTGTTTLKNFYVERIDTINDITIIRKILWNTQKSVTITSLYYKDSKMQEQLTEKYSWSIQ